MWSVECTPPNKDRRQLLQKDRSPRTRWTERLSSSKFAGPQRENRCKTLSLHFRSLEILFRLLNSVLAQSIVGVSDRWTKCSVDNSYGSGAVVKPLLAKRFAVSKHRHDQSLFSALFHNLRPPCYSSNVSSNKQTRTSTIRSDLYSICAMVPYFCFSV